MEEASSSVLCVRYRTMPEKRHGREEPGDGHEQSGDQKAEEETLKAKPK
jgi:hypothetical protein